MSKPPPTEADKMLQQKLKEHFMKVTWAATPSEVLEALDNLGSFLDKEPCISVPQSQMSRLRGSLKADAQLWSEEVAQKLNSIENGSQDASAALSKRMRTAVMAAQRATQTIAATGAMRTRIQTEIRGTEGRLNELRRSLGETDNQYSNAVRLEGLYKAEVTKLSNALAMVKGANGQAPDVVHMEAMPDVKRQAPDVVHMEAMPDRVVRQRMEMPSQQPQMEMGMQQQGQMGMQQQGQMGMQQPGQMGMQQPGHMGMQQPGQMGMQQPGQHSVSDLHTEAAVQAAQAAQEAANVAGKLTDLGCPEEAQLVATWKHMLEGGNQTGGDLQKAAQAARELAANIRHKAGMG